jgi:hypothetical protein
MTEATSVQRAADCTVPAGEEVDYRLADDDVNDNCVQRLSFTLRFQQPVDEKSAGLDGIRRLS